MRDTRALAGRPEVAAYLGVPQSTLAQWAHRGIGPVFMRVGRHVKYRWSDVEKWLDAQRVEHAG